VGKINMNVSGEAQVSVGNLAQGENVSITSGKVDLVQRRDALFAELMGAVRQVADQDDARIQSAEGNVKELAAALTEEPHNTGRIKEVLNLIKEHHGWAFPAIAATVKTIVPALAALL
jgi:hypothetical protein